MIETLVYVGDGQNNIADMYISHRINIRSNGVECPVKYNGQDDIHLNHNSRNDKTDEDGKIEHIGNGDLKEETAKQVPGQKWDFTICNYLQSRFLGEDYLLTGMAINNSTVFKVKLGEWRIIVCDHLGLKSLLDWSKVMREYEINDINTRMLRGHTPWMLTEKIEHEKKYEFLLNFFQDATTGLTTRDVAEIIQLEFEKMEVANLSDLANAEMFDFEDAIKKGVVNVIFSVFLGEYLRESEPDYKLIYEWQEHSINSGILNSMSKFLAIAKEKYITNKIFEIIGNTIKIKELKVTITSTEFDFDEVLNEIVYAIASLAIEDLKDTIMSSVHCYLRLSEKDNRLIRQEAEEFFKASNDNLVDTLPMLTHLHAFYMEVCRLHPLRPRYFRRAKSDFIMASTSGNFYIHKGDLLCGYPYMAQRNQEVFDNPNKFSLHRYIKKEGYGVERDCVYSENTTTDIYGQAFQAMSETITKIFVLFLTKCSITPTEVPDYTRFNFGNLRERKPLRLKNFHYER